MNMMETILAFFSGSVLSGAALWAAHRVFIAPRRQRTIAEVMRLTVEMDAIAIRVIRESDVHRCLVLFTTNGGGIPRPGSTLYATAIVNQVDEKHQSKWRKFEKLEIDMPYLKMLQKVAQQGHQVLYTESMEEGMLREIYEKTGVKYAEVHSLYQAPDAFYYASFASMKEAHLETARHDIRMAVNDFKRALREVFK